MRLSTLYRMFPAAAAVVLASGCAMQTPPYQPSIDNVGTLRAAGIKGVQVGPFAAAPGATGATSVSIRGNTLNSSVGSGYADYLAGALKAELELAKLLDPKANIEVTGLLIKNDISAGGFSTNSGEIEARFVVKRDAQVRYDRVKRIDLTWDSSFLGSVTIPKGQQQYPVMVQKLLTTLFADADFIAACR